MKSRFIILIIASLMLSSCFRVEDLPAKPRIEFRSFTLFDSTDILGNDIKAGKLTFYFEDGDGDIGIYDPDGSSADTTNLFFTLFRKENGVFTEVADDDVLKPSHYRIPYLEPIGQNDILKGTIDITMLYYFYSNDDTLRYRFFLKDRSEHFSNVDSTCVIVLGDYGTFPR